jgi:hypothetical protein
VFGKYPADTEMITEISVLTKKPAGSFKIIATQGSDITKVGNGAH